MRDDGAVSKAAVIEAAGLPSAPLDAAAQGHARIVPQARAALAAGHDVVITFPDAGHGHAGWRLAMVQELAREAAPLRVNALAGGDAVARAEALAFLARAPGITGQVLELAGNPAQSD